MTAFFPFLPTQSMSYRQSSLSTQWIYCENKTISLKNINLDAKGTSYLDVRVQAEDPLEELSLDSCQLSDAILNHILEIIANSKSLSKLSILSCNLGDVGASKIATAFEVNQSVTELKLSDNNIGDKGASDLADALRINQSLTELDLKFNNIGDKGASFLAEALHTNKGLKLLNFGNNTKINLAIIQNINKALKPEQCELRKASCQLKMR